MLRRILYFFVLLSPLPLSAAYVLVGDTWSNEKYMPTQSAYDHLMTGYTQLSERNWEEALRNFKIVTIHFQNTPEYDEALFYSGIATFYLGDFEEANHLLSSYLATNNALHHYEDVFKFKFYIANQFAKGAKKHLFGYDLLPRLMPATDDALTLYEEVIASMPSEDLAAGAFLGKADLQREKRQYRDSIETLLSLTRRFPKHEYSPQCYFMISEIYLEEATNEPQNPDLISLAKINLERFQKSFPGDERKSVLEENIMKMEGLFGQSLYETAKYYERKNKPKASEIYYREASYHFQKTNGSILVTHWNALSGKKLEPAVTACGF